MNAEVVFLLDNYLKENGIADVKNAPNPVLERSKGKIFSFEEHLKGLIYSLLTNQRKWSDVEPKLSQIDNLFFNYDIEKIKKCSATYFEDGIRRLKCGNISIKSQMANLHYNISILESIREKYGSLDRFVTSMNPGTVVHLLSDPNSSFKLKSVGGALAWEYLRNVGINATKPDTHLKRFMGSERMAVSNYKDASDSEVLAEVDKLSQATGYNKFEIDYLIWCFCASGKAEICTATPKCNQCVIRKYCKKGRNETSYSSNIRSRKEFSLSDALNVFNSIEEEKNKTKENSDIKIREITNDKKKDLKKQKARYDKRDIDSDNIYRYLKEVASVIRSIFSVIVSACGIIAILGFSIQSSVPGMFLLLEGIWLNPYAVKKVQSKINTKIGVRDYIISLISIGIAFILAICVLYK